MTIQGYGLECLSVRKLGTSEGWNAASSILGLFRDQLGKEVDILNFDSILLMHIM